MHLHKHHRLGHGEKSVEKLPTVIVSQVHQFRAIHLTDFYDKVRLVYGTNLMIKKSDHDCNSTPTVRPNSLHILKTEYLIIRLDSIFMPCMARLMWPKRSAFTRLPFSLSRMRPRITWYTQALPWVEVHFHSMIRQKRWLKKKNCQPVTCFLIQVNSTSIKTSCSACPNFQTDLIRL